MTSKSSHCTWTTSQVSIQIRIEILQESRWGRWYGIPKEAPAVIVIVIGGRRGWWNGVVEIVARSNCRRIGWPHFALLYTFIKSHTFQKTIQQILYTSIVSPCLSHIGVCGLAYPFLTPLFHRILFTSGGSLVALCDKRLITVFFFWAGR